jgi:ABC-type transport system involved in cytochrome bd biosynthesis fused ATPase/permease subunit
MAALEDKTVIFVRHQVEFLSKVDRILVGLLSPQFLKELKQAVPLHYLTLNCCPFFAITKLM